MDQVFSKTVTKQIDKLRGEIHKAKEHIRTLEQKITELKCTESPIKAGDTIYWITGNMKRKGKVISVQCNDWKGEYTYRCHILNKNNNNIGFANVTTDKHQPSLSPKE